jgi:adenylate cyclase
MTPDQVKRKLAAILHADVKGYSRLMDEDEEGTFRTLKAYKELIGNITQQHKGRLVGSAGDSVLAEFASVVDAVRCAVEIQEELKERNKDLPRDRRMEFRIGVNLGDVMEDGDTIYGDGVNIAARLEALAEPGGICISGTAYDHIENKIPLHYDFLGEQEVKNITKPVRVYRAIIGPEATVAKSSVRQKPVWKGLSKWAVGLIAIAVIAGGVALYQFVFRPSSSKTEVASKEKMAFPLPDKPSIAVLPFVNMSKDPEQEYFCDGITDQIITSLSVIPRLFVIARDSTFVYKGKAVKVQQVAEGMGVRYVLEGSVQRSGDRMRIMVQLIDAIMGGHLWSERYDKEVKDIFALQDEIAHRVMTALQVKLTEGEYASGVAGTTSNLKALECWWRAEEHFFRFEKGENAAARHWAEEAVKLDPNFAGAWAILGFTYMIEVRFGWSPSPAQSMERALACAQKAIGLSDSCAKAYALMGFINLINGKFDEAVENGERAVRIIPNDPVMLNMLSNIMHFDGKFNESIALTKNAMRLSPYYPPHFLTILSSSYLLAGRYEEALASSELLLARAQKGEFNPLAAHIRLAEAYMGLGQYQKARAQVEEVLKIEPNYSLANYQKSMHYKDPTYLKRRIDSLRKAGLK